MLSIISELQRFQPVNQMNLKNHPGQTANMPAVERDTVSINPAVNMTDEEAQATLQEVSENIAENQAEALSVHQGLDYDRVMALLGDI